MDTTLAVQSTKKFQNLLLGLASDMGFDLELLAENRIYTISSRISGKSIFIYNADLGINSASSLLAARDKSATFALLSKLHVPSIEHIRLNTSSKVDFMATAHDCLSIWGKLVVKDNEGTQGRDVFLVTEPDQLEEAITTLTLKGRNVCLSKYYSADVETRCIVYNNEVRIAFSKLRNNSWKHNLSQGAIPVPVDLGDPSTYGIQQIAINTAKALGMRFCSVDIMETTEGNKVLEVNGTVLMNHYQKHSELNQNQVRHLYTEIFTDLLA